MFNPTNNETFQIFGTAALGPLQTKSSSVKFKYVNPW
jgi:hypothetical protein